MCNENPSGELAVERTTVPAEPSPRMPTGHPQSRLGLKPGPGLPGSTPELPAAQSTETESTTPVQQPTSTPSSRGESQVGTDVHNRLGMPTRRLAEIEVELIDHDPNQVRGHKGLQSQEFGEMCSNVARYGVLQPVLVRRATTPGRYILIAGELRHEAARRAGQRSLPCYIEDAPLDQSAIFLHQLSENLHRKQLSHMDLARAFYWLTLPSKDGGGGFRGSDLAQHLGRSEAFISEHRALLRLTPEDQESLEAGTILFEQARAKLRANTARHRTSRVERSGERQAATRGGLEGALDDRSSSSERQNALSELPERLENGLYVYAQYAGTYPEASILVLLTGPARTPPGIDWAIRVVESHLRSLKLKHSRDVGSSTQS
jgi:ParB/RepB/Spo0J family partition protein